MSATFFKLRGVPKAIWRSVKANPSRGYARFVHGLWWRI